MDLTTLIPQFGGLLWTLLFFVVALSIIVAIHEYGHYIVGKKSGIYPEVFSIGFGPVLWSRQDDFGTKWQIAAIPFGGFVRFRGDANASGGVDGAAMQQMDDAQLRSTMHGAPLWARVATVAAGPIFNFILSIVLFTGIFMWQGQQASPMAVGALHPTNAVQELEVGDVFVAVSGVDVPDPEDAASVAAFWDSIPFEPQLDYTVLRDGREITVTGPYINPAHVIQIVPRSAARDAGLQAGDVITAVNDTPVFAFTQLKDVVESSEGATVELTVWRDGTEFKADMTPRRVDEPQDDNTFKTAYRIGIYGGMFFEPATETLGFTDAFMGGVSQVNRIISGSLSGMWHMVTGAISTCNLSGPIGIAETSGDMASQGTTNFIFFVAVLSTAVGLINLFPIPVLDGGHLVFYAYEAVTGKQPSEKALRFLMSLGLIVVLGVMMLGISSDLFC